jgi:hypothetical protein
LKTFFESTSRLLLPDAACSYSRLDSRLFNSFILFVIALADFERLGFDAGADEEDETGSRFKRFLFMVESDVKVVKLSIEYSLFSLKPKKNIIKWKIKT